MLDIRAERTLCGPLNFPVPLPLAMMDALFFSGKVSFLCMDEFDGYDVSLDSQLTSLNLGVTGMA